MAKIDPDKFGLALMAWSEQKEIPLRKIAFALGLSPNSIYTYTQTRRNRPNVTPNLYRAKEIADVLGITLEQLPQGPHGEGLSE